MKRIRWTLPRQRSAMGLLFVAPWLLGFVLLFAAPMLESLRFSLHQLTFTGDGLTFDYIGLGNFRKALFENAEYNRTLTEAVTDMLVNVPLILLFSLFSASLLNQKFRGRGLARAVFFLPVILASGVAAEMAHVDLMGMVMDNASLETAGDEGSALLQSFELRGLLLHSGMNIVLVDYLTGAVDRIYEIVSASGVQMLIFLAGLQSISPALYEASRIEGATGYEAFWKITFPMVSPLIVTNVVYSVIDNFTNNQMTLLIRNTAFKSLDFGLGSAMSWLYFLIISLLLVILTALISRKVFYYD
ncbi:MAG: sugar ABC transporter permease [Paenibacillaceae bacterium]|nr:sugar ABC transporter permease [Paenibacillaceae bacterium]